MREVGNHVLGLSERQEPSGRVWFWKTHKNDDVNKAVRQMLNGREFETEIQSWVYTELVEGETLY
jgi:TPP-dependent pyruvate/acetoin dehydrogenase alpha subunit